MEKIRISAVNYLNTKPFLRGLIDTNILENYSLSLDHPAESARKLIDGEVDIALVPVTQIFKYSHLIPVTAYGIAALGAVKTVVLFSACPIEEIETILLDYQSKTSVLLVQALAKEKWHIAPTFVPAEMGYENNINGKTAAVVIGDRTISMFGKYPYEYDLSEQWHAFTRKGFVFARWTSNRPLPPQIIEQLNEAFSVGLTHIDEVVQAYRHFETPHFSVEQYLKSNIHFHIKEIHQQGQDLFEHIISNI